VKCPLPGGGHDLYGRKTNAPLMPGSDLEELDAGIEGSKILWV
jgi:hypothetical protein